MHPVFHPAEVSLSKNPAALSLQGAQLKMKCIDCVHPAERAAAQRTTSRTAQKEDLRSKWTLLLCSVCISDQRLCLFLSLQRMKGKALNKVKFSFSNLSVTAQHL